MLRNYATPKYCAAHQKLGRDSYLCRWVGMVTAIGVLIAVFVLIQYLIG